MGDLFWGIGLTLYLLWDLVQFLTLYPPALPRVPKGSGPSPSDSVTLTLWENEEREVWDSEHPGIVAPMW